MKSLIFPQKSRYIGIYRVILSKFSTPIPNFIVDPTPLFLRENKPRRFLEPCYCIMGRLVSQERNRNLFSLFPDIRDNHLGSQLEAARDSLPRSIEKAGLPIITANQPVAHGSVLSATKSQCQYRAFWCLSHSPKYVTGPYKPGEDPPLETPVLGSYRVQLFGSPAV